MRESEREMPREKEENKNEIIKKITRERTK